MDGGLNSFMRFRYSFERVRSGEQIFPRDRWFVTLQTNPSQTISCLQFDANLGQAVDFTNSRPGHGESLALRASLRPTDRLELGLSADKRWVNVTPDREFRGTSVLSHTLVNYVQLIISTGAASSDYRSIRDDRAESSALFVCC